MFVFIWSAVLLAALVFYLHQKYSWFSDHGVRHLPVVPVFGNMWRVLLRRISFVEELDEIYQKYAEDRFVGRYEFMTPVISIQDLELLKTITVRDFEHFTDHRSFIDDKVEPIFGRSLVALKGQEWKDMRSTLSPAFTSSKIKLMVPFMEEIGMQVVRGVEKKIKASDSGYMDVDVRDLTSRYATDVIASCAFGLKVDSLTDSENLFYRKGKEISVLTFGRMMVFFIVSGFPSLAKKLKLRIFKEKTNIFFFDLVMNTMESRKSRQEVRPDMIHLLMEAKSGQLSHDEKVDDTKQDAGFAAVEESSVGMKAVDKVWSDNDLVAQAILFFMAGFDSISTAMTFALYELALHPEIQDRLVQEIKEHNKKNGGKLDFNTIQKMSYLDMVISETLRLWPTFIVLDRMCVKDYNLGKANSKASKDYIIRKGELISIPAWSFHRDPKIFPDPDKFDPERFSRTNKHNINSMAYMPFGLGPRNCLGSRFALCELKVLLYHLLLRVEVTPSEKTCIPAKLSRATFNLALEGGHWLRFKIRKF